MSQYILNEVSFFLNSFLMGVLITFVYDGFIILRRLFHHSILLISLEDMIFWIACAISVFYMLYETNNGILRWFAILAASIGMLIYKKTISDYFTYIMSTIIGKIIHILIYIIRFIMKPIIFIFMKTVRVFKKISKKMKKFAKYLKMILTKGIKLFRITLCKQ